MYDIQTIIQVVFYMMITLVSFIALIIGCCNVLDYYEDGKFYSYCKEWLCEFINSKVIGKILLIIFLPYLFIIDTITAIISILYLLIKCILFYIFHKKTTIKQAFTKIFGYNKSSNGDIIYYQLMGYKWQNSELHGN